MLRPQRHSSKSTLQHDSHSYVNPIDDLSVDYLTDTPDTSTAET
ncbi:hypothetical protein EVAR_73677_1, partial [Eumeta japonica]